MTDHVELYLRGLIASVDDAPLLRELTVDDLGTPRGTAAIARAALVHLLESRPEGLAVRCGRTSRAGMSSRPRRTVSSCYRRVAPRTCATGCRRCSTRKGR